MGKSIPCRCEEKKKGKERSLVEGGKGEGFKYLLAMKLQVRTTPDAPLTAILQCTVWAVMVWIAMMS